MGQGSLGWTRRIGVYLSRIVAGVSLLEDAGGFERR